MQKIFEKMQMLTKRNAFVAILPDFTETKTPAIRVERRGKGDQKNVNMLVTEVSASVAMLRVMV